MASGKTHFTASIVVDGVLGFIAYQALNQQPEISEALVIGGLLGTFITPDYDLEGVTITEGLIKKIPILGIIWVMLWYPYAITNPHRGRSHSIIGTIERQLYLLCIIWVLLIFIVGLQYTFSDVSIPVEWFYFSFLPKIEIIFVISLSWYCHDLVHVLLDK